MIVLDMPAASPPATHDVGVQTRSVDPAARLWRFHDEFVLGTRLEILINVGDPVLARAAAHAARAEIERLDRVFDHRKPDSEVTSLNRSRRAIVDADLFAVLQASETWREITRGAFDARIGRLLSLWSTAARPAKGAVAGALHAMRSAYVRLDASTRTCEQSAGVTWSLDAIAKGYIVDAALNAARRAAPLIEGIALGLGGDIRCWGQAPQSNGWRIGVADARRPADNAPLVDTLRLNNQAIATSGRGPRDCTREGYRSTTLSPRTGHPVRHAISASVVASHARDADAIATACMVMPPDESLALVDSLEGIAARVTDANGDVYESARWPLVRLAATDPADLTSIIRTPLPQEQRWPFDWEIGIRYVAPDRNEAERPADFRTPYMAMWITDLNNKPIYTLFLLGTSAEWQRDNFVWWSMHRNRAKELVELRSEATALSGRYLLYWNGRDDGWNQVPVGQYLLHLETSQERGKHTHRTLPLNIGRERFKIELSSIPDAGGLRVHYGHYNDRFELEE